MMRISQRTMDALAGIITDDKQMSSYKASSQLVEFFNGFGAEDVYGQRFPSRDMYTKEKLRRRLRGQRPT